MHGTVGGQLDEMSRLAGTFATNAAHMEQLRGSIDQTLAATTWSGPAAERFRAQWSQFAPVLGRLHEALTDAGTEVGRRRSALEAATS
ncbi:MAG TPA: WXG100 family type VII secretion target [Mycobacteriales bacterium]|jgi:WXG100 family type VII secretion target|nr:WXG100 family type VII secretion target [Mycobacteriales bacterium]